MGDQNTVLTAAEARQLLRRSGFGAPPDGVQAILAKGETRGQAADRLLGFSPSRFKPRGDYTQDIHDRWMRYLIRTKVPVQEKLVLFWHDHFSTSDAVIGRADLMGNQNALFRQNCIGNFKDFVKRVNLDTAMMEFLDTAQNEKEQPNENYARELMELFTLGVKDLNGNANYTQADIVQIARAFTGWRYHYQKGDVYFSTYSHDYTAEFPERGPKVVFQTVGGFGVGGRSFMTGGEGTNEIDEVVDILFDHTDSDGQKTVARHIAYKLLSYYCYAGPAKSLVDAVITQSGFATSWDLRALVRAIFVNDAFYETATPVPFVAGTKKSVKWPIDYVVSTMRLLNMTFRSRYQYVDGGSYESSRNLLINMGQGLFEPPSVFGWNWETSWVSSATLLSRYQFARDVMACRGRGRSAFRPDRWIDLSLTDPGDIVDAVTEKLGVTDQLTAADRVALVDYLTDNGAVTSLDLEDEYVRNMKLNGVIALILQSPAYQLH